MSRVPATFRERAPYSGGARSCRASIRCFALPTSCAGCMPPQVRRQSERSSPTCRTGVQASFADLVARYLGYRVKMYDGSFVEWSKAAESDVATGR
jgi:hypothetical protein